MTEPLVYIILLNWNDAYHTSACIRSLEAMRYQNFRIVVVDNGSTDDSAGSIEKSFPGIILLRANKNLGFSAGNNLGIRYALEQNAEFIWILNNDTVVEPDALTIMVKGLSDNDRLALAGCTILNDDAKRSIQFKGGGTIRYWSAQLRNYTGNGKKQDLDFITGCSMIVRASVFKKLGVFDERMFFYWEDVDFTQRVKKSDYEITCMPEAKIIHVGNASGEGGTARGDYFFSNGTVIFYKNHVSFWPVSLLIAYAGKVILRLRRGEFAKIRAVTNGFRDGLLSIPPHFED